MANAPYIKFNQKFEKEKSTGGKFIYTFRIEDTNIEQEGSCLIPGADNYNATWKMPDACMLKENITTIMSCWLDKCSSTFTKPPPLSTCILNTIIEVDKACELPIINPEDESKDWIIYWKPTRIEIDAPKILLYWAPLEKKENTRIMEELIFETGGLIEEVKLDAVPATIDSNFRPTVVNPQMEKDMEKVLYAYEKAHEAYEKAESYNDRFYKKYGFYAVSEDGSETSSFQSERYDE